MTKYLSVKNPKRSNLDLRASRVLGNKDPLHQQLKSLLHEIELIERNQYEYLAKAKLEPEIDEVEQIFNS
jgi:hypothetical protein